MKLRFVITWLCLFYPHLRSTALKYSPKKPLKKNSESESKS